MEGVDPPPRARVAPPALGRDPHRQLGPVLITGRTHEELIEAEYLAAEQLDVRRPDLVEHRPGWCEGIRATPRWAWRREGPRPFAVVGAC
jgi:hypothetical protein